MRAPRRFDDIDSRPLNQSYAERRRPRVKRRRLAPIARLYGLAAARAAPSIPRPAASAIPAANCACALAMIFSYIIRCVSLSAAPPPAPNKIMRNVITHCASDPKLAAASHAVRGFGNRTPSA
jgi:hypothetical protein